MTPDQFYAAGKRLFAGPHWQACLAQLLGVGERPLRRWLSGQNPIPEPVARAMRDFVAVRERARADAQAAFDRAHDSHSAIGELSPPKGSAGT